MINIRQMFTLHPLNASKALILFEKINKKNLRIISNCKKEMQQKLFRHR